MTRSDRMAQMAATPGPWSLPVAVMQIPETGLQRDIAANPGECTGIAELGGLLSATAIKASLLLTPIGSGNIHVTGRVTGRVGQACVVTLDPIESDMDEAIDLIFAPPTQIRELADSVDEDVESENDTPDPPEPIDNGFIDLGKLATDALFLGLDPYPRKPDAVFEVQEIPPDPEDHPFAALQVLKDAATAPAPAKAKKQPGES